MEFVIYIGAGDDWEDPIISLLSPCMGGSFIFSFDSTGNSTLAKGTLQLYQLLVVELWSTARPELASSIMT
jgi:hypothetical protein